MNMHVVPGGTLHPRESELMACIDKVPGQHRRVHLRERSRFLLEMHLRHGPAFAGFLSYRDRLWYLAMRRRMNTTDHRNSPALRQYLALLRDILNGPRPLTADGLALAVPEAATDQKQPAAGRMNLNPRQRRQLLALKREGLPAEMQDAEAVWEHYMTRVTHLVACGTSVWRMQFMPGKYEEEKRFLALQNDLMATRALTRQQLFRVKGVML